ncbi:MAG: hypothetical protein GX309_04730 [Clostridiales bacterium]|nr:hypothetical protein [Clostridiales bacterium]
MIFVYDKKTRKGEFSNNGLAVLNECSEAYITEELNGQYFLELKYPAKSPKAKYLIRFNILKAEGQLFRIYKIERDQETNLITVFANHIFYDLSNYFIEDSRVEKGSIKTAMMKAMVGDLSTIYTVDSDVLSPNTLYMVEMNPAEAMFKIIERWKLGELYRDNFDIKILKAIGKDSGVLISYGKNIKGFKITEDSSNIVTKIYPKGANGIKLTEKYILVPNWDGEEFPPFPMIKKVEFKEANDEVTLRQLAKEAAKEIGLSNVNISIDFLELSKTKQYEKFKELEKVSIGDIVTVHHKKFKINAKVKIIKIKRDLLSGINTKVELGQPLKNILKSLDATTIIKNATDEIGNQVAQTLSSMLYYANAVELTVSTIPIQPVYLGIGAVANTNLSLNLSISCIAEVDCTLTIKIELDGTEISFKPKQKLLQGANTLGIPLGIPQVPLGGHYIGMHLVVDTGKISIPIYNFQCMIDGRNLQGGLSTELPHAEVMLDIQYEDLRNKYINKQSADVILCSEINDSILEKIKYIDVGKDKISQSLVITFS